MINVEQSVECELAGETKYSGGETCPSATLSTTNSTWPDLGLNPGRRAGKPETNRLSYGTAGMAIKIQDGNLYIHIKVLKRTTAM
jgi:hypothetical protein